MALTLSAGSGGKLEGALEFVPRFSGNFEKAAQEGFDANFLLALKDD
jgi:hypothetical protein